MYTFLYMNVHFCTFSFLSEKCPRVQLLVQLWEGHTSPRLTRRCHRFSYSDGIILHSHQRCVVSYFLWGVGWLVRVFACGCPTLQHHLFKKTVSPPSNRISTFDRNQLDMFVWVFFGLSVVFPWALHLSLCQRHTVLSTVATEEAFIRGAVTPFTWFFSIKIVLVSRSYAFPYTF